MTTPPSRRLVPIEERVRKLESDVASLRSHPDFQRELDRSYTRFFEEHAKLKADRLQQWRDPLHDPLTVEQERSQGKPIDELVDMRDIKYLRAAGKVLARTPSELKDELSSIGLGYSSAWKFLLTKSIVSLTQDDVREVGRLLHPKNDAAHNMDAQKLGFKPGVGLLRYRDVDRNRGIRRMGIPVLSFEGEAPASYAALIGFACEDVLKGIEVALDQWNGTADTAEPKQRRHANPLYNPMVVSSLVNTALQYISPFVQASNRGAWLISNRYQHEAGYPAPVISKGDTERYFAAQRAASLSRLAVNGTFSVAQDVHALTEEERGLVDFYLDHMRGPVLELNSTIRSRPAIEVRARGGRSSQELNSLSAFTLRVAAGNGTDITRTRTPTEDGFVMTFGGVPYSMDFERKLKDHYPHVEIKVKPISV